MADETIRVPLAHHLEWPRGSGERHQPGDELEVTVAEARSLIGAGMVAGVSPADPLAVRKILHPDAADQRSLTPDDTWTVPQLQAELERLGQPTTGKKPDLIARLADLPATVAAAGAGT